jgi:hypothetical protein
MQVIDVAQCPGTLFPSSGAAGAAHGTGDAVAGRPAAAGSDDKLACSFNALPEAPDIRFTDRPGPDDAVRAIVE